jgi:ribosomal protein S18 acetylase RimI-like enzyme
MKDLIELTDKITLRLRREDEEETWKEVFKDSIRSHFQMLDPVSLGQLLEFQYVAQKVDYDRNYPGMSNYFILFEGQIGGRVMVYKDKYLLHLIDFSVLTELRGNGIGGIVLDWLIRESLRRCLPIRFYVEKVNRAFNLYERKGFRVTGETESHLIMECRPGIAGHAR